MLTADAYVQVKFEASKGHGMAIVDGFAPWLIVSDEKPRQFFAGVS
jgi:hypothetical protein